MRNREQRYNKKQRKTAKRFDRVRMSVARHSFFLRVLLIMLIVACVPMSFVCVNYVNDKTGVITQRQYEQLSTVAKSVAIQLDEYIGIIHNVDLKIKTSDYFKDRVMTDKVQSDIEIIDALRMLQALLPFVTEYGVYVGKTNRLYLSSGKYNVNIYEEYVTRYQDHELVDALNQKNNRGHFLMWNADTKSVCYIVPSSLMYSGKNMLTGYYRIGGFTLRSALEGTIPKGYQLVQIELTDGTLLYASDEMLSDVEYMYYTYQNMNGMLITMCVPNSQLIKAIEAIQVFPTYILVWSVILILIMVIISALVSTYPVKKVFIKIRDAVDDSYGGQDQLQFIMEAYSNMHSQRNEAVAAYGDVLAQRNEIEARLREEHRHMLDGIVEKMLRGQKISEYEQKLLPFVKGQILKVACMQVVEKGDLSQIISKINASGEMYALGFFDEENLVVISSIHGEENPDERIAKNIGAEVEIHAMSISDSVDTPAKIVNAYKQASANLRRENKKNQSKPATYSKEIKEKVIQFTEENYCNPDYGTAFVAENLDIQEYQAGKLLREVYGVNYSRLINERRVERAKELMLGTNDTLGMIAESVGFQSASYFIRVFRSIEDVTPSVWRDYMKL